MGTKELEKKSSGGGLVAAWKQNPLVSTGLVLILMIVVQTAIMIYNFGEGSVGELLLSLLTNWLNILRNNAPVGIIALGMTFVIISGGIDLSVGSTLVAVGAMVMMVVDGSATGLLAGMGITGHAEIGQQFRFRNVVFFLTLFFTYGNSNNLCHIYVNPFCCIQKYIIIKTIATINLKHAPVLIIYI